MKEEICPCCNRLTHLSPIPRGRAFVGGDGQLNMIMTTVDWFCTCCTKFTKSTPLSEEIIRGFMDPFPKVPVYLCDESKIRVEQAKQEAFELIKL